MKNKKFKHEIGEIFSIMAKCATPHSKIAIPDVWKIKIIDKGKKPNTFRAKILNSQFDKTIIGKEGTLTRNKFLRDEDSVKS